ncbi:hypothetical protein [Pseudaminobacter soli (ex Li et al. 2025)]|uniref:Uncharacterized protein n=1 Tax=Pseudaminobacter soli (ex Li et al. 2025) TaxID=1295366 RepID=A0A2P7RML6_9HYPH|nr:hypothetical protein [Mesorhizobium soli]PSJ51425.1 hypothetical protein C7I85_29420 [Mesorhizobium soli]
MTRLSDALEVRDSILPLLIGRSRWEETNIGRVLVADAGQFEFLYRTPFQREVLHAMRRSHVQVGLYKQLEYGLTVWRCYHKVLDIEWDHKDVRVLSYRRRGSWESELAAAFSGKESS